MGDKERLVLPTLIFALYLMGAAAAGVLLVVGCRTLALSAGWTASAGAATVIAIALSASVGSALLAPRSDRTPTPAAILAVLFALFGTAALLSPFLLRWVQTLYLLLWPLVGGTAEGTWGLRLLLALTLLALPSAVAACVP